MVLNIVTDGGFDFGLATDAGDQVIMAQLPADQLDPLRTSPFPDAIALLGGNDYFENDDTGRIVFGNTGNDSLVGGAGNDTIYGGQGEDTIIGGAGNDVLSGDFGNDTLSGGLGADTLIGGDGANVFLLARDEGTDVIQDFVTGNDVLQLPDGVAVADVSIADGQVVITATGQVLASVTDTVATSDLVASTNTTDTTTPGDGPPDLDFGVGGGGEGQAPISASQTLANGLETARKNLADFAESPSFNDVVQDALGSEVNLDAVYGSILQLADNSVSPEIIIRSAAEIGNAAGAYDASTNTVLLSQELLDTGDSGLVMGTILEEWGHYLDDVHNSIDSPGDEGELFSLGVRGIPVDAETRRVIKSEDDAISVQVDGELTTLETSMYYDRWLTRTWTWENGSWQRGDDETITRSQRSFSANWGNGKPSPATNNDYFYQHLFTQDRFVEGQTYQFNVNADDYYFLAVQGPEENWEFLSLDNGNPAWKDDAYGLDNNTKTFSFTPSVSGDYWIVAGIYEQEGLAYMDLSWYPEVHIDFGSGENNNGNTSNFEIPLPGGYNWRVNQSYAGSFSHSGKAAIDFGSHTWDSGNGLKSRSNIPVLAADDGVVLDVISQNHGYGKYVRVDHDAPYDGSGLVSLYAHLDSLSVQEGQSVSQGDKLGIMGNTGNSTGTHLHFELFQDGSSNSSLIELKDLKLGNVAAKDFQFSGWGFENNKGYRSGNRYYSLS